MALTRVNTTSYKFEATTATTSLDSATFTEIKGVTGFSVEDNSTYKSIRSLGDGKWQRMVRETVGATFTLNCDHIVNDADDTLDPGQQILADASNDTTIDGNIIGIRFTHPNAHKTTVGVFSVHNGFPGTGMGGSDGSFNTATYRLVSHGEFETTP